MEKEQDKNYWYEYTSGGFSRGGQPEGFVSIDHIIGDLGAIAYRVPLTDNQLTEYKLKPVGVVTL